MVFYESYLYLSKRMKPTDIVKLLKDTSSVINKNHGTILAVKDLGWRRASFRVNKPRVGVFWFGRMFYISFGANPNSIKDIRELYNTNSGILRHLTTKLDHKHNLIQYNNYTPNRTDMKNFD